MSTIGATRDSVPLTYKARVWVLVSGRMGATDVKIVLNGSIRSEDAVPFTHPKT